MLTPCQTYFPLGERVGVYFFPLGRGFLVRKVIFCFVCCCVDFPWRILVCPVVVVLNFIFYWYLYLFSLLVSLYPIFFCFWSFRELSNFEVCFASFCSDFKEIILSFSVLLRNFGEILLFCTTSWLFTQEI